MNTDNGRPDLDAARKQLEDQRSEVEAIIKILTAEQALKAQRIVREAGRRRGRATG